MKDFSPIVVLFVCLLGATLPTSAQGGCGNNSPYSLPPEELWPEGLTPAEILPLAPWRDSTDYITQTIPGWESGHELFKGVAAVGGHYLFVAYNAGIQVWDIAGPNAARPQRLAYADGWQGHFFEFPPSSGEEDSFLEEIAVAPLGPDRFVLAASGRYPVGMTLWVFAEGEGLQQIYQAGDGHSFQTRIATDLEGNHFALSARDDGIEIYDIGRAVALGACRNEGAVGSSGCSSVALGRVRGLETGRFLDVLRLDDGSHLLVASDGNPDTPLRTKMLRLFDLESPGAAVDVWHGGRNATFGLSLFRQGGHLYLADAEAGSPEHNRLAIWNITSCGSQSSGCDPRSHPALVSLDVPPFVAPQYLSLSTSVGSQFLYYGAATSSTAAGPSFEHLLDLSYLDPEAPDQTLPDLVESPVNFDFCSLQEVGYFGWFLPGNNHGLRKISPRRAIFAGGVHLYRAAYSVLDIHRRELEPTIAVEVATGPHYQGTAIELSAVVSGCPDATYFQWAHDDPSPPISSTARSVSHTFPLCSDPSRPCPPRSVVVTASAAGCRAEAIPLEITLLDPRPTASVALEPAGQLQECDVLEARSNALGAPPLSYRWTLSDPQGRLLFESAQPAFQWAVMLTEHPLFTDGFETGSTARWGSSPFLGSDSFVLGLSVSNAHGSTAELTQLDILPRSPLTPGSPPFFAEAFGPSLAIGSFDNGTERQWVFEDENGLVEDCPFGLSRCHVSSWTEANSADHTWYSPNRDGSYTVGARFRDCRPGISTSSTRVSIDGIEPHPDPALVLFDVEAENPACDPFCAISDPCDCQGSVPIRFLALGTHTSEIQVDWDADGSWDAAVPVAEVFTHEFPPGTYRPIARPRLGSVVGPTQSLERQIRIHE